MDKLSDKGNNIFLEGEIKKNPFKYISDWNCILLM